MRTLSNIWFIAQKDLLQLRRDRAGLLLMFVVPLALMGILGAAIGNFGNGGSVKATLPFVNESRSHRATALLSALRSVPGLTLEPVRSVASQERSVRDGDSVGLLIIPRSFGAKQTGTAAESVTYYTVEGNNDVGDQLAQDAVKQVVQDLAFSSAATQAILKASSPNHPISPSTATQLGSAAALKAEQSPPVRVSLVEANGRTYTAATNAVPGYGLMFALFAVTAAAGTILKEKESGTLKRLLVAPVTPVQLLGGKLLAQFLQTLLQLTVLFAAGALLFKINLGGSVPALALLIVGTSFAATGVGMVVVSFVRSQSQLRPVTTLIVLTFSALGGSWWPISVEPNWMQNLANISLTAWAMKGFNGLMIFDKSLGQVMPDIAALFIYGVICFAVARRTFQLRPQLA